MSTILTYLGVFGLVALGSVVIAAAGVAVGAGVAVIGMYVVGIWQ